MADTAPPQEIRFASNTAPSSAVTSEKQSGSYKRTRTGAGGKGGSVLNTTYGKRSMKAYPVTDADLSQIGLYRKSSTIAFSIATLTLGVGLSAVVDAETSKVISERFSSLEIMGLGAIAVSLVAFLIGWNFSSSASIAIENIKASTFFGDD